MGRRENYTGFLLEKLKEIGIILKRIFKKLNWGVWTGHIWLGIGTVGDLF
jgi:hypothetical protein